MKSGITIVPMGGLCNRMRSIASGVFIARRLRVPARVFWIGKHNCRARFDDLFEPVAVEGVTVKEAGRFDLMILPPSSQNLYVPRIARSLRYKKQLDDFSCSRDGDIFAHLPEGGNIYLSSGCSMAPHYPLNELFVPVPELAGIITRVTNTFPDEIIGIHIRRTDNVQSIAHTGVGDYIRRMLAEVEKNNAVKFYLATDSPEVKEELISQLGDRIIHYDAALTRSSLQGMKDAVIDLWCLSRTKCIIGSYYSSYSDLAAELGGIQLEILGQS